MRDNRKTYLVLAVLIFAIEVLIALYVRDGFIRPYLGDFLVVILLYCCIRAVTALKISPALMAVLLFSYVIEFLQLVDLIDLLHFRENRMARLILGTSFSWLDIIAYTLGITFCAVAERFISQRKRRA